jgi:D-alanyl-D-alanine carboxypeptidase
MEAGVCYDRYMPHHFISFFLLCLVLGSSLWLFLGASANEQPSTQTPVVSYGFATAPHTPVGGVVAYVVLDEASGQVLMSKNSTTTLPLASTVKLFLAAAAFETDNLLATTTITAQDVAAPEDFGKLAVGQIYTLSDLLFPYLLESSNDAGAAIEREWGDEIRASLMSLFAKAVVEGVVIDDFSGVSAMTSGNADEIARLLRHIAENSERVFDITRLPRYIGQELLVNNNPLRNEARFLGGKHGYTVDAGRTLVARLEVDFGEQKRVLDVVILGSEDLVATAEALTERIETEIKLIPQSATTSAIIGS